MKTFSLNKTGLVKLVRAIVVRKPDAYCLHRDFTDRFVNIRSLCTGIVFCQFCGLLRHAGSLFTVHT